jgi:hypothetical protein
MAIFGQYRLLVIGGSTAVIGAAVAGWIYSQIASPAAVAPPPPVAPAGATDQTDARAASPAPDTPQAEAPAAPPEIEPPAFDVVRVAEDGGSLVAGSALSGVAVVVRVDGAGVAETAADGAGQFVALFSLAPSEVAQVMTLEMILSSGEVVSGRDSVILAPRPVLLAAAAPSIDLAPPASDPVEPVPPQPLPSLSGDTAEGTLPELPMPAEAPLDGVVAALPETVPPATPEAVQIAQAVEPTPEAAAPVDNFILRESGEVVVLGRAPQVLQSVVVDAISYRDEGDLVISGRVRPDQGASRVQLYLDNQPVALALASSGDWAADLPAVDPGIYALRVDEIDEGGRVISRFETPFQREAPEIVVAAQARAMSAPAELPDSAAPPTPRVALITVQPGHTLWHISTEHYGEGLRYVQIFNANRSQIRNPDLIYPGQVFLLPEE